MVTIAAGLSPATRFEVNAATKSRKVPIDRDEIEKAVNEVHQLHPKVNGGGNRIGVRTDNGKIVRVTAVLIS